MKNTLLVLLGYTLLGIALYYIGQYPEKAIADAKCDKASNTNSLSIVLPDAPKNSVAASAKTITVYLNKDDKIYFTSSDNPGEKNELISSNARLFSKAILRLSEKNKSVSIKIDVDSKATFGKYMMVMNELSRLGYPNIKLVKRQNDRHF